MRLELLPTLLILLILFRLGLVLVLAFTLSAIDPLTGFNQLLLAILRIRKLPLTNMRPIRVTSSPDFIRERALLALGMLERARAVEARIELTRRLDVRKRAAIRSAVCAVSAERHVGVLERAVWVRAVREESAECFGLVGSLDRRGGVASDAFPVLAGRTEGARI